jgi:hypothetical protein
VSRGLTVGEAGRRAADGGGSYSGDGSSGRSRLVATCQESTKLLGKFYFLFFASLF